MRHKAADYMPIFATIGLTVYGQIVLKWRVANYGTVPSEWMDKVTFFKNLFLDPYIFSGFFAGFLASIAWMAAMTRFEISHAYPFMSLNFALVLVFSYWFLSEPLSWQKVAGIVLIVVGTILSAQG